MLTLASGDANRPPYYYKVADAYLVSFMNEDGTGDPLQSTYQEVGKTPVYMADEPTKGSTSTNSFTFDGWSSTIGGDPVSPLPNVTSAGATYYAHFATTTLKYRVHLDAATNGGECVTENIYVNPGAAVSTLPVATKYGHSFDGWFTAATGGTKLTAETVINADANYFAQFTANSHTLTWNLNGGTVSTAGKIGSTTWPVKNATGAPSTSVAYGTIFTTIPVVTKTGYTFASWSPIPGSSMPDENVTYAAQWNPNTNTAYTVKHYKQNVDGTYPSTPTETQSLTGTTATYVTPTVKSYEGFVSPAAQTVTIGADGKTVVTYQYARMHYTFTLDAATNGGTTDVPSIDVIHGATIGAVPPDAEKGCNDFLGWFTKPTGGVKITSDFVIEYDMKKLYAQFSDDIRTWPINYQPGANGDGTVAAGTKTCDVNATITSSTFTRTGYTQTGWSTTDGGAQEYAFGATYTENATLTLYPVWTINKYTVTWKNGSATIETDTNVNYGTMPSFDGTEPTKPIDASYAYTFDGWSTTDGGAKVDPLPAVSGNTTYYAHYSTTPTVASVKVGTADPTYYTNLADAFAAANAAESASTIKMLNNVSGIAASLVYSGTQNCTLDLNNHTIAGTVTKLINVNASGKTFTIDDSSTTKGGKISTTPSANSRVYGLFITAGMVNLKHGIIYCKNKNTGSSASASAIYVTADQKFTMDDGTVESESKTSSYALYIPQSNTSEVTINGGLIKGHTNSGATAGGIYNYCTKLTINGGHIIGHAWTNTSYGINQYGKSTIKGGIIEATNDTTNSKGTTTAYGIFVQYKTSTYNGAVTIPSTSTVQVLAKARTNTAYAVYISSGSSSGNTIAGGTFTAIAKTGKTAGGVYTFGTITISGGTFNVSTASTAAYGIYTRNKTTTVSGNPVFNVTSGSTDAYGAFAYGYVNATGKTKTSGTIKVNGGTFNVTSGTTTAYGAYAGLYGLNIVQKGTEVNDTIFGQHYMPGIIEITDGTFNTKATTTGAYGIVVAAAKSESGAVGTTTRYPQATIKGGKYKAESLSDANATAYAMNTSASETYLKVQGGKYSTKKTGASTNIEGKYTQPTKTSVNYWVLDNADADNPPYLYEVAEAYKITFKNGETTLQEGPIKKNTTPAYNGAEPTKDPAGGYTYTFDGWSTTDGGDVSPLPNVTAAATYYAHFNAVSTETGPWLDIVDAHDGELVINMTSLSLSGWPYQVNGVVYGRKSGTGEDVVCNADRTITLSHETAVGAPLTITVKNGEGYASIVSKHQYTIPKVYENGGSLSGTDNNSIVYVRSGILEVTGTKEAKTIYVDAEAELKVTGTLNVDKLVLRTTPSNSAKLTNNGTLNATDVFYTRKIADNSKYYQFGLPLSCDSALNKVCLSDGTRATYGTAWMLKSYDTAKRAKEGNTANGDNWQMLTEDDRVTGGVGYEMFSGSKYYREFYFSVDLSKLTDTVRVAYASDDAGPTNAGWNVLVSPLTSTFTNDPIPEDITVSWMETDGFTSQTPTTTIAPAKVFSYQASKAGKLTFEAPTMVASAPRRRVAAAAEPERIQWMHLDIEDDKGLGDETSIYSHPTRYEEAYKTGIDVAKQSLTASRAILYSSHAYGDMAFAGVADALLEKGVALTIYSPFEQILTISMRDNNWLNRMAYVWLVDTETGIRTNLLNNHYTFRAAAGTTTGRFYIEGRFFAPQTPTDIENGGDGEHAKVQKIIYNDKLYILIGEQWYDATGKKVISK